ncbi:MAG: hypothetical protein ACLGSA_08940 [Acidobacteriota bacterium]
MRRFFLLALAAALFAGPLSDPAQARLIKEMQVTRAGKVVVAAEGQTSTYRLLLANNKYIVIGDREFFQPATRAALDQAVERKLAVEIMGQMLIFNDQAPVFTLPLGKLDIKGLEASPSATATSATPSGASSADSGDPAPFKDAKLKFNASVSLGQALDSYAFFSSRSWKVLGPDKAEFRGDIDLSSITEQDSRYVNRLRSKDLHDTFKSLTFVAVVTLQGGTATCPDPSVEAVFQDGVKDRLVWKDPPTYYWDKIYRNKKLTVDYFLSKAALNPKYGKTESQSAQ